MIAWNAHHAEERLDLIHELSQLNIQVDLVPSWFEVLGLKLDLQEMEGTPLLTVPYTQLSRSSMVLKRGLDIAVTSLALVLLSPLFAAIALAIKLNSRGPVFFRQQRVGKDDRPFMMLKFRSMYADAEERKDEVAKLNFHGGGLENGLFKIKDDPRVTQVGRWLRAWSLDELPQLSTCFARRHEPRRAAAADRERGSPGGRSVPPAALAHAGPHRAVAGRRPFGDPVRPDGQPRLPLCDELVDLGGSQDPHPDTLGSGSAPRRVLAASKSATGGRLPRSSRRENRSRCVFD